MTQKTSCGASPCDSGGFRRAADILVLTWVLGLGSLLASARAADTGIISGTVSNAATGNLLEGAKIAVPALGLIAYTDDTGLHTLPNMNAGEVAIRLPGVAGNLSDENLVDGFTIRGIAPGLNSITLDGAPLTSQGALTRSTNINNLTGTMFDQMELTKGHTPDKGASSLGGTINLRSRSPLSMREKRCPTPRPPAWCRATPT